MLQVNRNGSLKIPKQVEQYETSVNSIDDAVAIKKALASVNEQKININALREKLEIEDQELERISKIPFNANDLIVITVVKKLGAYVIAVTEKSPKKFRGVFVNRMQNYCLDTLELLLQANLTRMDSQENKMIRVQFQKAAIVKLKLLGYVAMIAESSNCILKKQYKQISIQLAEAINLIAAWKKSDDERWRKKG